jgi:metal-sulfur cluster biosynthetic enzyme
VPYFFKEGRMEAIQDVRIHAMRDDEWVFSGYSFTDPVWFDRAGKMHTGPVPASHAEDLWGVGFFHRDSRDAFVALWLEHTAENFDNLGHNGSPAMNYDGHGQLWSRYPARNTDLQAGATFWQRNAYLVIPYSENGAAGQYERWRHRFLNPLEVQTVQVAPGSAAASAGRLARFGETAASAPLKPAIWKTLEEVKDEQFYTVDANVVALGLIYDIRVRNGVVHILMTMPHRGRPVYEFFLTQGGGRVEDGIVERVRRIEGVRDVVIEFTWEPAWNVHRMTDAGQTSFGLT